MYGGVGKCGDHLSMTCVGGAFVSEYVSPEGTSYGLCRSLNNEHCCSTGISVLRSTTTMVTTASRQAGK